jgi:hypothetical protein
MVQCANPERYRRSIALKLNGNRHRSTYLFKTNFALEQVRSAILERSSLLLPFDPRNEAATGLPARKFIIAGVFLKTAEQTVSLTQVRLLHSQFGSIDFPVHVESDFFTGSEHQLISFRRGDNHGFPGF